MGLLDLILFPVYVLLFHIFFSYRRSKLENPLLKKYHKQAFWIKIMAAVASTIFNCYISPGDSTALFYTEGKNIYELILHDSSHIQWLFGPGTDFDLSLVKDSGNPGYFRNEGNFFIIKLVAFFSFISFGKYSLLQLFFSMIAFTGIWKLFRFFYSIYPTLHKQLAIAILFLPTLTFWSSGVLKDPICVASLGWLTYSLYFAIVKKKSLIKNILISVVAAYVLFLVKPYILFAYIPFFFLYLILSGLNFIKNGFVKSLTVILVAALSIVGFIEVSETLQEEMGLMALDKLTESVETQQVNFQNMADRAESSFSLGVEYDGSPGSLLRIAPAAINATMFRPYLWESKKISTLLSSLESLTLMLLTLYVFFKAGPVLFFSNILKDPMVMFCFFFSLLFALFIGATTLNFGTLVRYKIPCMPFYIIAMLLIFHNSRNVKARRNAVATTKLPA